MFITIIEKIQKTKAKNLGLIFGQSVLQLNFFPSGHFPQRRRGKRYIVQKKIAVEEIHKQKQMK